MTIIIEEEVIPSLPFDYKALAESVIQSAIEEENFPFEAEVCLTLTDNAAIREINREHRGIDRATDVLSFPMIEYEVPGDFAPIENDDSNFNPDSGEAVLGDIVLSLEKVEEQAEEFGHTLEREYAFLILHSMLHLFGYDHMNDEDAAFMENKQKAILNKMNILR